MTEHELVRDLAEKSSSKIVLVPYNEAYIEGFEDMRRRIPEVSKLRRTIGYAPDTSLDESLRRIIEAYPTSSAARVS